MVFGIFGRSEQQAKRGQEEEIRGDGGKGGKEQAGQSEFAPEYSTSAGLFASANLPQPHSPPSQSPAGPSYQHPAQPQLPSALDTLSSAYDATKLHPLAGVSDKLDFLQLDDDKLSEIEGAQSVLPSRGWTDDLCVGTGTAYVSGLGVGGAWGLKEGLGRQLGPNSSAKLRLNSILNACSRRGVMLGNSLGVLAIFYNITNSSFDAFRGQHDVFNSMGAAALAGGLYRCTAGVRPAAISAGIMAGAAGLWSALKNHV